MRVFQFTNRSVRSRLVIGLLSALALIVGFAVPAEAAVSTPGKAASVTIVSVEGSITVKWNKTTGAAPSTYRVVAVPVTGPTEYPCGDKAARRRNQIVTSFQCAFSGKSGVSSYRISVESRNGSASASTTAATVVPIATKTLTLTGSLTGSLTRSGTTTACPEWNLKGSSATGIPNECLLQVYAITSSGLIFSSATSSVLPDAAAKSFTLKIKAVNASRANVTLQLARGDGSYIGPVLFSADGKNTLNGQSFVPGKTTPADKTIALGAFALHTRANKTAFMTAQTTPAATALRTNKALMKTESGSDVAKVPVGAGKAGFVSTIATTQSAWNSVLSYGVTAHLSTAGSIFAPEVVTPAPSTAPECSTFFDNGATVSLSSCFDGVVLYLKARAIDSQVVDGFSNNCAQYRNNSAASTSWLMSKSFADTCRTALVRVLDELNGNTTGGNQGNNNQGNNQNCSQFAADKNLTLRDCYDYLLMQLSQQNATLVFAFTTACGPYGAKIADPNNADGPQVPLDPVKYAKPSNFQTLVTSKTDLCGLFMRINSDSAGGASVSIAIPTACKTSFGALNDPTGTLDTLCYSKLQAIDTVKGTQDVQKTCPIKLRGLPKSQWGDPSTGIGYSGAFNCLMLLEKMGAGSTNNSGANCSTNTSGADGDSDGIPNALDVDDDGDLVIDTADSTGGTQSCNIEPSKGVRSSITDPLNYGLIDAHAPGFNGDTSSAGYGALNGSSPYAIGDLNSSINYFLSGTNFSIAYYVYKSEFFPNAKLDADGSMPAVWVTCPGVVWCDAATSRATIGTGVEMKNSRSALSSASYDAGTNSITYSGSSALLVYPQSQVTISGFPGGNVEFNYANADVTSVSGDGRSFTIAAPTKYCTYQSDQSNEIIDSSASCPSSTNTRQPSYSGNATTTSNSATVTLANPDFAPGFNKTAFSFQANAPWRSNSAGSPNLWQSSPDSNKCAYSAEVAYQQAVSDAAAADTTLSTIPPGDPGQNDARLNAERLHRLVAQLHSSRSFRTPCWSELTGPVVFTGAADQNGQCPTGQGYSPTWTVADSLPPTANFLWQTRCLVSATDSAASDSMSRIIQGAFISPNINQLAVNTNSDHSDDLAAKDALSANDVLTLNYIAGDGTVASVATTIGAYPITAPLIRALNGETVDYSLLGNATGATRPIGSAAPEGCMSTGTNDCLPHATVVDPSVTNHDKITVTFDRPQREAFPGENSSSGYHDVYGLSYGLEMDAGGHTGCGSNFAARRNSDMPVATSAYSNFSTQFSANISQDSGAAYLAPLKDKVADNAAAEPAAADMRLSFTLDIVKCLRDRAAFIASKGLNIRDLQLPYGARTDGLASGWVPRGVGNGDSNCLSLTLNGRGEAKTGGTDSAMQTFCVQLAPGSLTDWTRNAQGELVYDPTNVHGGNYLIPSIMRVNIGQTNGETIATAQMGNYQTFSPSCQWSVSFTDLSNNNATVSATGPDSSGTFTSAALTTGHQYRANATATGCAPRDLTSDPTESAATFIANQNGGNNGGNNGCQTNCNNNGQQNTPQWGKSYTGGSGQFQTFIYNYDATTYDWMFSIVDESNNAISGVTIGTPVDASSQGAPPGTYRIDFGGLPADPPANYKLRMGYRAAGTTQDWLYRDSPVFAYPFSSPSGCASTASNGDVCQ